MNRLALVADTHAYQAGLPLLLAFLHHQGLRHLACLGDCLPDPFRPWLGFSPQHCLSWIFDVNGPEMPQASRSGVALELTGQVYLAHTRATLWSHFKDQIHAYQHGSASGRPPLLLCHGHTHVPSLTLYTPPVSRLLYINDAVRPQQFQSRQACVALEPDSIYLIVPGAFTLEDGRHPAFSFAVLDLAARRVAMVSLRELASLESLTLFPT